MPAPQLGARGGVLHILPPGLIVQVCWNTGELYSAPAVVPAGRALPIRRYAQPVLQCRLYFVNKVPGDPVDPL
jgi:hypothetical protein